MNHPWSTTAAAPQSEPTLAPTAAERLGRLLQASTDPTAPLAGWRAAAEACRDELLVRWARTQAEDRELLARADGPRRVHYLSMEFLLGRTLANALDAVGLSEPLRQTLARHGHALSDLLESEPDAALGNGGLGRLAACFLDSFATVGLPSFGYGMRYEFGMFAQGIEDGRQVEHPDPWLRHGNPWEIARPEVAYHVGFGGRVEAVEHDASEAVARRWLPAEVVLASAHDLVVPGHGTHRVSTLRLWSARAEGSIDYAAFCRGEHLAAGRERHRADLLNWVLYPDDSTEAGRELRLRQEFLLVSASVQDIVARHLAEGRPLHELGQRNAIHLNDTHPALAPLELMRLLLDEHGLHWDAAWAVVRECMSYTNHTLMPEALEAWPVRMLQALLPRHLEIAYEINHRHLDEVRAWLPGDEARAARLSLVDEHGERRLRMAHLAIVASHRVNGVSALHSRLMVESIFADFAALAPERFINVTNGVTQRRWLAQANPALAVLLDQRLGPRWRQAPERLAALAPMADSVGLGRAFLAAKRANKQRLSERIRRELGLAVDPDSLFDVQVKRIHEYKRQLLNLLHVVARYQAMLAQPDGPDGQGWVPRTVVFAGKAASAYHAAKTIVRLIHDVARVVNADPRLGNRLKLVFLPNYSVSLAELIIPAADLSEQISTAGTEASGTGNMKFALNGALTIGTWDGANIEMAQAMGEQRMFIFGHRAEDVAQLKTLGYDPSLYVERHRGLAAVLDAIAHGEFSAAEPQRYRALVDGLRHHDPYLVLADFETYLATQARVDALFRHPAAWAETALHNVAAMGRFSSDRTVRDYAQAVWARPAARTVSAG